MREKITITILIISYVRILRVNVYRHWACDGPSIPSYVAISQFQLLDSRTLRDWAGVVSYLRKVDPAVNGLGICIIIIIIKIWPLCGWPWPPPRRFSPPGLVALAMQSPTNPPSQLTLSLRIGLINWKKLINSWIIGVTSNPKSMRRMICLGWVSCWPEKLWPDGHEINLSRIHCLKFESFTYWYFHENHNMKTGKPWPDGHEINLLR